MDGRPYEESSPLFPSNQTARAPSRDIHPPSRDASSKSSTWSDARPFFPQDQDRPPYFLTQQEDIRPSFLPPADRPLFGVSNKRDRLINLVVGCVTILLFLITLVCAFFAPRPSGKHWPPYSLNIYFAICICFIAVAHAILIYWYRQGDLDPKFRLLIYYNAFAMVAVSICAISYFFAPPQIPEHYKPVTTTFIPIPPEGPVEEI